MLNRYIIESAALKAEISRLQTQLSGNGKKDRSSLVPVIIPVTETKRANTPPLVKTDTVYISDTMTVRVMDTIRTNDTLTLIKTDTITRLAKPVPARVVIQRDTVVTQQAVDFTTIPADIFLFDLGSSKIRQVYNKRLDYLAAVLIKNPGLEASITGHTDKSGSPEINTALSHKRAENVATYFTNKDVPPAQLVTSALSWLEPAVLGNSTTANSQNRRVVVRLRKK